MGECELCYYIQLKQQAIQLEVERKKHEESLEWERLRIEQEEQQRIEDAAAAEKRREMEQVTQADEFEESTAEHQKGE